MLSRRVPLILLVVVFALTGCQPEEKITRTARPRLNDMKRLLAAIVLPDKDQKDQKTWFFKLVGLESEIDPLVDSFHDFLKTVRFDTPETPVWTLPQGWTEEKDQANKLRFATIHTGAKGKALELTVFGLEGEKAASVPDNVIRWRIRDLGLNNILRAKELEDFYHLEQIDKHFVIMVDMVGPGGRAEPVAEQPMEAPKASPPPFQFKTPEGWQQIPPTDALYVLSFVARDKDKKADINVSVFKSDGGGIMANVNRWRGQVGLGGLTPDQVKSLPEVTIGNAKGALVDVANAETSPQSKRIIGAIVIRERDSLFFKMMGPGDWVGKQRPAFESFLKSIQFGD